MEKKISLNQLIFKENNEEVQMKEFAKILIIAVFSLVLFASSAAADVGISLTKTQSNTSILVGTWENELGSTMTINSVSPDGEVRGSYETAVSASGCAKGTFPLVGRTNLPSFGFVVSWTNTLSRCSSVTAWSGQLQTLGGQDQLVTTWLLTAQTVPRNNWQSTTVNKDIFKRKQS